MGLLNVNSDLRAVLGTNIIEVDHVAIAVENLEQSVAFYSGIFGMQLLEQRITRGERTAMFSAVLKAGSVIVVLVQGTSPESQVSKFVAKFGTGVQHVALRVENLQDTLDALEQLGIEPAIDVIEGQGIRQVFLKRDAANAVRYELIERRGGNFTDDTVERLFREFEKRDLY